ncbi:MAG: Gldg family protein [Verrucomicrobiales bacterium]
MHRGRIALNTFVQLVLLVAICAIANYLSCRHHRQWDLTVNNKFTLSTTSTNFLDSLDQEVKIMVAFLAGSPVHDDVRGLVSEYQRRGGGHITVEFLDPGRNRTRTTDIKNKYNLELDQNVVIIATGDRVVVSAQRDMVKMGDGGRVEEFRGEAALTSALIEAIEKDKTKLYLITGHRRLVELQILMKEVHDLVKQQNAEVVELLISHAESVPEDCGALLLIGPTSDFSKSEIEVLRAYWEDRKGSLLLLLDPEAQTPNLFAFLRSYGVVPRSDRLLYATRVSGMELQKTYATSAIFLPGSPVTRELMGVNTVLPGLTQSLKLYQDDAYLKSQSIISVPLLLADDRFWGETDFDAELETRNPREDHMPPLYLAAAVEKGATEDPRLRIESSRLVVAGNRHFLDSSPQRIKPNLDFVLSSLNWMLDREELIGITPKFPSDYNLSMSPKQFSRIEMIVLIIMPAGVFIFGLIVWSARRQ